MDIVSKSLGDSLSSTEFNQIPNEIENALSSTGQTPSSGDVFQLAKGIADYASHGDFYADSGAADAYVLSALGSKQSPTAYGEGFRARFVAGNTNTGASTINVAGLGVKNIKNPAGNDPLAGDITSGLPITLQYDDANGWFFIYDVATGGDAASRLLQQVFTQDGAVATGTTQMPIDDTIPQNTEGDEYITQVITPTDAANILKIEFIGFFAHSSVGINMAAALFQDSTVGALAAGSFTKDNIAGSPGSISLTYLMVAGTTSATTFKIRGGSPPAGTTTFNGVGGARQFGGVMSSSLVISEIKI